MTDTVTHCKRYLALCADIRIAAEEGDTRRVLVLDRASAALRRRINIDHAMDLSPDATERWCLAQLAGIGATR
jgi:hypothetical protein